MLFAAASSRPLWRRRSDASRCVRWRRRGVGAAINRAPAARRSAATMRRDVPAEAIVFVFSLGGPTPSEAAGGRPLTQRSKTLGPF